jgi:hypothetical protein
MAQATNLLDESLISLNQAARLLPPSRHGSRVSFSCIFRWVTVGLRGLDGELVRLEASRMGGRWLTSKEALQRFADRLTPRFGGEPASTLRTPDARRRASSRASRRLSAAGI